MKYLLFIIVLFVANVNAQKYIPNKEYKTSCIDRGFKGKVKSVTTKHYHKIISDSALNVWRQFTTDSIARAIFLFVIEEQNFDTNGLLQSHTFGNYYFENHQAYMFKDDVKEDNATSSIPTLSFKLNDTTNVRYKFVRSTHQYVYDSLNRLIQVKQLTKNAAFDNGADFIYDERGNVASSKFWEKNNSLVDAYENKYDKNDSLVEVEHYNYRVGEFDIQKFKYYGKNKYEVFHYLNDGNLYRKEFFNFNEDGTKDYECTWTHRSIFKKRHIISKGTKNGHSASYQFFDNDGKLTIHSTTLSCVVDNNGYLTYLESKDEIRNKIYKHKYQYIYNTNGNLANQIGYDDEGKIISKSITTYEYY